MFKYKMTKFIASCRIFNANNSPQFSLTEMRELKNGKELRWKFIEENNLWKLKTLKLICRRRCRISHLIVELVD